MGFERKAKAENILQTQEKQAHYESKLKLRAGSSNTTSTAGERNAFLVNSGNNRPVW